MKFCRQELPRFMNSCSYDVIIQCREQSFYTHKLLLAASSDFLEQIFKGVSEDTAEEPITIILPESDPTDVDLLVRMFYNDITMPGDKDVAPDLFAHLKIGHFKHIMKNELYSVID